MVLVLGAVFMRLWREDQQLHQQVEAAMAGNVLSNAAWSVVLQGESTWTNLPPDQPRSFSFTNSPIKAVLRSLARQGNFNFLFHRSCALSDVGRKFIPVTIHWEQMTPREAFEKVLTDHQLRLEKSPNYPMVFIYPADRTIGR
jgi:hypothetical protein